MTPITLSNAAPQWVQVPAESWSSCSSRRAPMSEVVLRVEAARDGREVVESVRGHHPGVLDADPAEAKLVEPGLHGDDIAFSQRLVAGLAKRRLFVHIETNAVAGAVVHLGHAIRTLVANRRSPIAAVDQDLAYGEVNVFARHTRPDRLHPRVERLQRGGMHALKFIGYLADDHRAREVPVVVAAAPHWKDVDDHRRTRPDWALAAEMRQRALGRAGDDHFGAREAHLAQDQLGARVEALRREGPSLRPQDPVPDISRGQLPNHLDHRGPLACLDGLRLGRRFVPALAEKQLTIDTGRNPLGAQVLQVRGREPGRHPGLVHAFLAQHLGGQTRPRFVGIHFAVLDHIGHLALGAGAIDFERADHEHVIVLGEADVQAGLDREAGGIDEVGITIAGGDEDDGLGARGCRTSARPLWAAPTAGPTSPRSGEARARFAEPRAPHGQRDRLQQLELLVVSPLGRASPGAALQVQLLLDLVPAGVSDLVSELSQLREVTPEGPFGYTSALGELEGVEPRLGDDRGEDVEKTGEPAGAIRPARFMSGWLADLFPGGGVALKRIGLGLFLVPHLLVEPAGDHLVSHRLGDAQLGERLDLVGHDLVAAGLDRRQYLFDGRRPLDHELQIIPKLTAP